MASSLIQIACLLPLLIAPIAEAASAGHGHIYANYLRSIHQKRASAVGISTKIPAGWASQGCWTDDVNTRTLASIQTTSSSMSQEYCVSYCSSNGYPFAGVEYANECFCGKYVASGASQAADADCNMACAGNSTQICGGPNRLNLFKNTTYVAPVGGPAHNPGPAGWGYLGCYSDSTDNRTMSAFYPQQGSSMTVGLCTQTCQTNGYVYAGVEYAQECFCSNSLDQKKIAPDGWTGCNMVCNGNSSEYCGGPNRLDVYGFASRVNATTSSTTTTTIRSTSTSSVSSLSTTASANATTTGLISSTTMSANMTTSFVSSTTASLNSTTTSLALNTTMSLNTTTTTPISSSTSVSSTTSSAPTTSATSNNWSYRGCYIDNANGRILGSEQDSSTLTVESCISYCQGMNMTIAGMEYSTQCFCGNYMQNGGKISSQDSDCAMKCGGNSNETCGGPNRMSIYASGNFTTYQPPKALNTTLPGKWSYKGCLPEGPNGARVFPYQMDQPTNLTVSYCLNLCDKYGYNAAGLEYGQQCFCGDDTDRINAGVNYIDASQCNMACAGAPDATCGGPNVMNYYSQPATQVWGQGVGNSAGQYQFLIGGVVIPLITTVGTNNKVTFVEKHGTGPKNSTGAFELDLSQTGNFSAAWRTMNGIKTDVFCSAGLTLPDKVGRQINIGGWSTESLFGIRFYWPDGSPGVASKNDWQENVNEVALQVGRWYPTAMQMVNGSILVVGGEDGSNGKPVPNLEVIPKPPGGNLLYMDWLNRTDPNNLYPYLVVLPSGNIAVFYWNEARILDEKTFQTVRTLPNIPGAVNNDKGGRTYPLEGTSMILPQVAPYTDPLTVLICGGSTPYQGFALDNCVSIQPENPKANWTIERMPDRRVISCMTALPDGTYLILNGAHQGQAGFGLASDANHMAVLYDPTKPLYNRMTRLANSTIDRLYHSEAILLPDGRVLVSGSDPEDQTHEQEYRVEVFIPPYLMANNTRPAYTIPGNGSDWSYGKSYTITLAAGSTCAKVALMGAVSSTHGNSMGQRSIFPAFSCKGQTCTITAPPNGYITGGPGWFMLFVLNEAGTPSISQWVRIGGDPAGLGNWPNYSDFTLPGV